MHLHVGSNDPFIERISAKTDTKPHTQLDFKMHLSVYIDLNECFVSLQKKKRLIWLQQKGPATEIWWKLM